MYVYVQSEPGLFTGFSDERGKWYPDFDTNDREEAAERCAWLNGSGKTKVFKDLPDAYLFVCKKPGSMTTYASVDPNDSQHWPIDQWKSVERFNLYKEQV